MSTLFSSGFFRQNELYVILSQLLKDRQQLEERVKALEEALAQTPPSDPSLLPRVERLEERQGIISDRSLLNQEGVKDNGYTIECVQTSHINRINDLFPSDNGLLLHAGHILTEEGDRTVQEALNQGGSVSSVNGKKGEVVLMARDLSTDRGETVEEALAHLSQRGQSVNGQTEDEKGDISLESNHIPHGSSTVQASLDTCVRSVNALLPNDQGEVQMTAEHILTSWKVPVDPLLKHLPTKVISSRISLRFGVESASILIPNQLNDLRMIYTLGSFLTTHGPLIEVHVENKGFDSGLLLNANGPMTSFWDKQSFVLPKEILGVTSVSSLPYRLTFSMMAQGKEEHGAFGIQLIEGTSRRSLTSLNTSLSRDLGEGKRILTLSLDASISPSLSHEHRMDLRLAALGDHFQMIKDMDMLMVDIHAFMVIDLELLL